MRTFLIALLMTLATQVGAEVQVSLSNVVSDAQLVNGDNKFTGHLRLTEINPRYQIQHGLCIQLL